MAELGIGRHAPCRCGSGLRYGECCLVRVVPPPERTLVETFADPWGAQLIETSEQAGRMQVPLVPPCWIVGERRIRQVSAGERRQHHYRPAKETLHEFFRYLLISTLGSVWCQQEEAKPPGQQHELIRWFGAAEKDLQSRSSGAPRYQGGNVWQVPASGHMAALLVLAYDLYCVLDRGDLPESLLARLRDPAEFQGARYELAAAGTFVRAGFQLRFVAPDRTKRTPEFVASDHETRFEIAVEAKSRHRPGILGFGGIADEATADRGDVDRLVNEALEQNPRDMPFVVFVEVNAPVVQGVRIQDRQWLRDAWGMMGSVPVPLPEKPAEFTALVFTNFSYNWDGSAPAKGVEYLHIVPKYSEYPLPLSAIGRVLGSIANYGKVPGGA